MEQQEKAPLNVGDELRLECINIGIKGDGIFKTNEGYVVISNGAETGKTYDLRITRVFPNVAFAEIMD